MSWAANSCRRLRAFLVLVGIVSCTLPSVPAFADEDATEKALELEQLRGRIKSLQTDLQNNRKKKTRAEQRLEAVEQKINASSRALKSVDAELTTVRAQLQRLQQESRAASADVHFQAGRLARRTQWAGSNRSNCY